MYARPAYTERHNSTRRPVFFVPLCTDDDVLTTQMLSSRTYYTITTATNISSLINPLKERKGKEEYLYSAILADTPLTKRSDMDHTVLTANYTMSAFPS